MNEFSNRSPRRRADRTIALACEACGEVEVGREHIWLIEIDVPGRSWFGFDCPRCLRRGTHSASPFVRQVLRRSVVTEEIHVPAEAREEHLLPPLTLDDLLDAVLELSRIHTPEDISRTAA